MLAAVLSWSNSLVCSEFSQEIWLQLILIWVFGELFMFSRILLYFLILFCRNCWWPDMPMNVEESRQVSYELLMKQLFVWRVIYTKRSWAAFSIFFLYVFFSLHSDPVFSFGSSCLQEASYCCFPLATNVCKKDGFHI